MKIKPILSILFMALFFISCNQDKVDELTKKNKELEEASSQKDSSMSEMLESFNKIQANLKEIKAREGIIEVNSADGNTSDISANINDDIEAISNLMRENEELMNDLNIKLRDSKIQMSEFKKLINSLNNRVESKNKEIATLNEELQEKKILIGQLYFRNDSLKYANKMKDAEIEDKIDELNTGYYAYGTYKELKENNVLTKEGGFLGIGKSEGLKNDFNTDYFSKVDIRKQTSFLLYAKKAKLITTHPESSYEIKGSDGKADSLIIKDVEAFWKASKYLVIQID